MTKRFFRVSAWAVLTAGTGLASPALAQMTPSTIIQPILPPDFDRGRNVSVTERQRPDYDPLGVRVRSFLVFPRVDTVLGFSDNVYATEANEVSEGYIAVAPSVRINSDWSKHLLSLSGGAAFRRYFSQTLVNSDQWYANGLGRVDVGNNVSLFAEAQASRIQEDPFSGETASNVAALSRYERYFFSSRAQYRAGRIRATLAYDHSDYNFNDIQLSSGAFSSQADRDRNIDQITGQIEYASSPSLSFYAQGNYAWTDYDQRFLLSGQPNRDSKSWRLLGGVNVDISGFLRGTVGVGYSRRMYNSPVYGSVDGLSAEAKLEYFPSELTTFTLTARRAIEDTSFANTGAYYNNRLSLQVDHELRRNLLLNASADFAIQDYIESPLRNNVYRANLGGDWLLNRSLRIRLQGSAAKRERRGTPPFNSVRDDRATISFIFQR